MCGVIGCATSREHHLTLDDASLCDLRELLIHRGPDDAGLVRAHHIALAHRRLALLDLEGGAQPFELQVAGVPRVVLAWNGEIYNHQELRKVLAAEGAIFRTRSDTETLAQLLARRGTAGLQLLRGMFAIAAWFPASDELLLARDPFGIVPLYHARVRQGAHHEVLFASEPGPILAHPLFDAQPDWASVASYLELPRRSFGARTMYSGLSMVMPGEALRFDLSQTSIPVHSSNFSPTHAHPTMSLSEATWRVRDALTQSIETHMVADAPVATLLSGGIDSTIIAAVARTRSDRLVTFAAGAERDVTEPRSDLFMARRVATLLGSEHHEVLVDRETFAATWSALVSDAALPLATPNEIAISMLGHAIAPHAKGALSGEGADELFGGYGAPLEATLAWIDADIEHTPASAASFYRTAFGWSPRALMPELFDPAVVRAMEHDGTDPVHDMLHAAFTMAGDLTTIDAHLEVQRRVNLVNLLERLNVSLMRGSVEGRVPFADLEVLRAAHMAGASHLVADAPSHHTRSTLTAQRTLVTKRVLREAFTDVLSPEIVARPKASFPLPFEQWIADASSWIDGPGAREVFTPAARALIRSQAAQHWRLAWPVLNLARWLDRF